MTSVAVPARARRVRLGGLVSALAVLTALGPVAIGDAATAASKAKKKAVKTTKAAVKKQIPGAGVAGLAQPTSKPRIKVSSCKQKPRKFKCTWAAQGEAPGIVPFRCKGTAVIDKRGKKVKRIGRCNNNLEAQAPLLEQRRAIGFGYYEDFSTHTLFTEAAAGGATIAREDLFWNMLQPNQPTPGEDPQTAWDWSYSDSLATQFRAVGVRPVWTFINAPCWASSTACSELNPPSNAAIDDYAKAAAEIAKRYPDSAAIEVWLEPNGKFWGTAPDPALYSELVGQTVAAVDATGTGVQVISGGLAPGAASPDKLEFSEFVRQAVAHGGIQAADAIGFHAVTEVPFKSGNDPTDGYLGRLRVQIRSIEDALADGGVTLPIALTQLSYSTTSYSEAEQAEALSSSFVVASRLASVSFVIVSRLFDNGDGSKVSGFGVLRPNGAAKPAYCDLASAAGVAKPLKC